MGLKTGKPRGWRDDAAWRHARAVKAGKAAARAHRMAAVERSAGLTPVEAFNKGYLAGYHRAYHAWKARVVGGGIGNSR